jgi:proteasome alpha subunit
MQSNDQRAYDRGVTVFSPDGRLYQVEYAREAVKRGSPAVGVTTDDSVVLAAHGQPRSPLIEPESIEKVHDLDGRLGVGTAGHVADARRLVDFGRKYAQRERLRYGEAPAVEPVAKAVADQVQESTQTGGSRPFGAALLVGGVVNAEPRLYEIDPSGTPTEWLATAVGSGSETIRSRFETDLESTVTTEAGVSIALSALDDGTEGELVSAAIDLAVLDEDGFRPIGRAEVADALDSADLSSAS